MDDFIDGKMKVDGSFLIPVRLVFGLVIGIFALIVIWACRSTYRDVMNAEDDPTTYGSRNPSDVNRSRIRNGSPQIKRIKDLEMNLCATMV